MTMNNAYDEFGFVPDQPTAQEDFGFIPEQQEEFAEKIINNPLMQGIYGAGDAFTNALSFGYLGNAAKNIGAGNPSNLSYKLGELAGDVGAAAIPGSLAAKGIRAGMLGAKAVPYANLLGNIAGGGEWGFATHPENRKIGALGGALAGTAASAISPLLKATGKAIPSLYNTMKVGIRPVNTFKNLTEEYSEKSISPMVQEGIEKYTTSIGKFKKAPFIESPEFNDATQTALEYGSPQLRKYSARLVKNPTLEHADALKKQINEEIFDLQGKRSSGLLDTAGSDRLASLENLKNSLKPDLAESLARQDPNAATDFLEAETNWATNVHPVKTLSSILKNMSHKTDLYSKTGANKAAETILKEYIRNPRNIPANAVEAAKKIAQQSRNIKILKNIGIYGGGAGLLGGGGEGLLHLLGR